MWIKTDGGEECVLKIWDAWKGFTGFAQMISYNLDTRRWLADTFALNKIRSVIG